MIGQYHILSPDLPVELALLLRAIRHTADPENQRENQQEIQRLAAHPPNWACLADLAARHRVSPVLYLGLKRTAWRMVPAEFQDHLKSRFTLNLKRNFRLSHHASRIIETLTEGGVRVIPYKGIFLAETIYGQLSSREVNDIDLLISHEDSATSHELLRSLGFEPTEKLDQQQIYRDRDLQIEIDLHWQITPDYFPVAYDFQQLWSRSAPVALGRVAYRALANEDLLLFLCIQVAKDSWERQQRLERLQKVCDIAAVVNLAPDLNWLFIRQHASQQGICRVVNFALALTAGLLDTRLPEPVSIDVAQDRKALLLARQACAMPFLADTLLAPGRNSLLDLRIRLRQLFFYLRLRERQRDKWRHIGRVIRTMTTVAK